METKPWIVLEATDLDDYLVSALALAGRTAALSGTQTDRFDKVMPDIAERIRTKCKKRYRVSRTENAIPPELKWVGCCLILEVLLPSILMDVSEDLRTQCSRAVTELNRVEDGKTTISMPEDPMDTPDAQTEGGIRVVSGNRRIATRETMDGL